jgi:DNA-binding SARP family transcriptional activator
MLAAAHNQGRFPTETLLHEVRGLQSQVAALHGLLKMRASTSVTRIGAPDYSAGLYAKCFGRFRLFQDGQEVRLGSRRLVMDLLRLLVGAGRPIPRDELLELLWPEGNPSRSGHRLHVAMSAVRRVLNTAGAVRFEDDAYMVDPDTVVTDCQLFEASYEQARRLDGQPAAQQFLEALSLYEGDFLADRPYAEWALQRRAHFLERRLTAVAFLADYALDTNDAVSAAEYATIQLIADSLRERAHRQLMRAHYRLGQRACAIRQYDICAELLKREVGVAPSKLTRQLRDAIAQDAPLPVEPGPPRVVSR